MPVYAVRKHTEMLLREVEDRGRLELLADLRIVHQSAEELQALIEALLDSPWLDSEDSAAGKKIRHDLRNPLTVIIGYCELWVEQAKDHLLEGFVPDLEEILALARKMLALLDELMNFSKAASDPEIELPPLAEEEFADLPRRTETMRACRTPGPRSWWWTTTKSTPTCCAGYC